MPATVTVSLPLPPPAPAGYRLREVYVVGRGSYPDCKEFLVDEPSIGVETALSLAAEYWLSIGTKRSTLKVFAERDGDDVDTPFMVVSEWSQERKTWMPWRAS